MKTKKVHPHYEMSSACQTNNPTGRQPNTSMQINLFSNPFSFYRRAFWSLLPYTDPGHPVLYRLTIFICGTFSGLQAEELLRGKERIPPRNPQAGSYLRCAGSCRMSGSVCSSRSVSLSRFVSAFRSLSLPESRSLFRSAFPSLFPFQTAFPSLFPFQTVEILHCTEIIHDITVIGNIVAVVIVR